MIRTKIPKLDKEQTKQLVSDLKSKTSKKDLLFWKDALKQSKKIKRKEREKMKYCICGHNQENHIGNVGNCMTPDIEYWKKYHIIKDPCECEVFREEDKK